MKLFRKLSQISKNYFVRFKLYKSKYFTSQTRLILVLSSVGAYYYYQEQIQQQSTKIYSSLFPSILHNKTLESPQSASPVLIKQKVSQSQQLKSSIKQLVKSIQIINKQATQILYGHKQNQQQMHLSYKNKLNSLIKQADLEQRKFETEQKFEFNKNIEMLQQQKVNDQTNQEAKNKDKDKNKNKIDLEMLDLSLIYFTKMQATYQKLLSLYQQAINICKNQNNWYRLQ